jgi:hypothetical protein
MQVGELVRALTDQGARPTTADSTGRLIGSKEGFAVGRLTKEQAEPIVDASKHVTTLVAGILA